MARIMPFGAVSAIFDTQADAHHAVSDLRVIGVRDSELSVVMRREGAAGSLAGVDEVNAGPLRAILGGGAVGARAGVATLTVRDIGTVMAAGAFAASAVPAAIALGVASAKPVRTLGDLLAPHAIGSEDAAYYGAHLCRGGVLVWVDSGAAVPPDTIADILNRNGGHDSRRRGNSLLE
jgi:hypothetical protein